MDIGHVEGMADVSLGDKVIKRGRTTRKTIGEVIRVGLGNIQVAYQENTQCNFEDQIEIMGAPGKRTHLMALEILEVSL